jgi:hypothetical protein
MHHLERNELRRPVIEGGLSAMTTYWEAVYSIHDITDADRTDKMCLTDADWVASRGVQRRAIRAVGTAERTTGPWND